MNYDYFKHILAQLVIDYLKKYILAEPDIWVIVANIQYPGHSGRGARPEHL